MLEICKELFAAWNTADIKYCHWKSNEHLSEGLMGLTDLDVFVALEDRARAQQELEKCGYINFRPQKGSRYPLVEEWIGFDYATGGLVHIHLHYQIITGTKHSKEYVFPVDESIISTRVFDTTYNVYVASPELEIIILYSRIVLKATDKKKIKIDQDYQKEIDYLKERVDWKIVRDQCCRFFADSSDAVYNAIREYTISQTQLYEIYNVIKKWLKPYKKFSTPIAKLRYRYFRLRSIKNAVFSKYLHHYHIGRKTLPNGGLSVCFLGADGSGKSTVSIDICKWLNWKIEASRFYLGSGDHYNGLLKKILSFGSSKASKSTLGSSKKETVASEHREKQSKAEKKAKIGFLKPILKSAFDTLQAIYLKKIAVRSLKELKKAKKYAEKGAIALFDRFPQNQFQGLYDGPKIASRFPNTKNPIIKINRRIEEKAIAEAQNYRPDVIFKLLLPAEESIRRKPDHTIEEVKPKAEITQKLVFESSLVYDIDATQAYSDEILEIKRWIWKAIGSYDNRI